MVRFVGFIGSDSLENKKCYSRVSEKRRTLPSTSRRAYIDVKRSHLQLAPLEMSISYPTEFSTVRAKATLLTRSQMKKYAHEMNTITLRRLFKAKYNEPI